MTLATFDLKRLSHTEGSTEYVLLCIFSSAIVSQYQVAFLSWTVNYSINSRPKVGQFNQFLPPKRVMVDNLLGKTLF